MTRTKLLGKLFLVLLLLNAAVLPGQEDEKPTLETGTVEEQFDYVVEKSHIYEDYRVIKSYIFNKLKKQVSDTMKIVRSEKVQYQQTIHQKDEEIDTLNYQLAATQQKLERAIEEKNTLSFFGIPMAKGAYNSIVWFIIVGLTAALVFFLLLYKRSHSVIKQARTDLEETKEEFEKHRKRALEREEQVVRRYHDELNKYKEKSLKQH